MVFILFYFIVILSFNCEYCLSPSFALFFIVSGSRIQIYFILGVCLEQFI